MLGCLLGETLGTYTCLQLWVKTFGVLSLEVCLSVAVDNPFRFPSFRYRLFVYREVIFLSILFLLSLSLTLPSFPPTLLFLLFFFVFSPHLAFSLLLQETMLETSLEIYSVLEIEKQLFSVSLSATFSKFPWWS